MICLAYLTQQVFYRHFTILEIKLHRGRTLYSHLMFFRSLGKTLKATLQDKGGKFISVHFGKYGIHIRKSTIRDPAFLPVQYIMLSVRRQNSR